MAVPLTLARMSGPMERRASAYSLFCSMSTAPTRRMMAGRSGKMPTTSARRRSSLFSRSGGWTTRSAARSPVALQSPSASFAPGRAAGSLVNSLPRVVSRLAGLAVHVFSWEVS